jgi:hypothetical protein
MDLAADVEEAGWSGVTAALNTVARADHAKARDAARALAAAELVAKALGHPPANLPEIEINGTPPVEKLSQSKDLALTVVARVRERSELAQLWDEAGEAESWRTELDGLEERLSREPVISPPRPKRARILLREGDCYGIPLPGGGFSIGFLSQLIVGKLPFGYFFGPRRERPPTIDELQTLRPAEAILRVKFGDTEIQNGRWQVLGQIKGWNANDWPTPPTDGGPAGPGRRYRTEFPRDAPKDRPSRNTVVKAAEAAQFPPDRVMGGLAVETELDRNLPH